MTRHLVVGAGAIGLATARELVRRGDEVTLATRSGTDPGLPGVRAVSVDASDADALSHALAGAATLVNATNPRRYYTWEQDWPPVANAILSACERAGAGLVTISNLYGYGPMDRPITEDAPLRATGTKGRIRARMWADALAAHQAGRIRATEVRPSDYFGPGAHSGVSQLNRFVIAPAAAGKPVWLVTGYPDVPHSWTYADDIGALAATLATDERSWGRPWHVPTTPARTARQVVQDVAALVGRTPPPVRRIPSLLRTLLRVSATVRELDETAYQFERPFVLDSAAAEQTFGLAPTPWQTALEASVAWLRES